MTNFNIEYLNFDKNTSCSLKSIYVLIYLIIYFTIEIWLTYVDNFKLYIHFLYNLNTKNNNNT